MKPTGNDPSQSSSISVWCIHCKSNLLATPVVISEHFIKEHGRAPTEEEIKRVLTNTFEKKFRGKKGAINEKAAPLLKIISEKRNDKMLCCTVFQVHTAHQKNDKIKNK